MIVYGSGISDGNSHSHDDLPILLAGKANGTIKTGRHVRLPERDTFDQSLRVDARPDGRQRRRLRRQHGPAELACRMSTEPLAATAIGSGRKVGDLRESSPPV